MYTTLLANNSQHCWMLRVSSVCTSCCMLLGLVAQCLKTVKFFSYIQMDATTTNDVGSCWLTMLCPFLQGLRDCRKILLPLGLIKKTFCYRMESVRSGSTTHHFFDETDQWYSQIFPIQHVDLLFVCFFFANNRSCDARFWWKTILEIKAMITLPFGSNLTRLAVR